jgi:hypothetical protein
MPKMVVMTMPVMPVMTARKHHGDNQHNRCRRHISIKELN